VILAGDCDRDMNINIPHDSSMPTHSAAMSFRRHILNLDSAGFLLTGKCNETGFETVAACGNSIRRTGCLRL
jgi:hypothetical protein